MQQRSLQGVPRSAGPCALSRWSRHESLVGKSPPSGTQAALEIPEMEVTRMTKSRAVLWILSRSLLASAAALTSSVVCTILGQQPCMLSAAKRHSFMQYLATD